MPSQFIQCLHLTREGQSGYETRTMKPYANVGPLQEEGNCLAFESLTHALLSNFIFIKRANWRCISSQRFGLRANAERVI